LDHYSRETTLLHQIFGGYLRSQGKYHRFKCSCVKLIVLYSYELLKQQQSKQLIIYYA